MRLSWRAVVGAFATGSVLGLLVLGSSRRQTAAPIVWKPPTIADQDRQSPRTDRQEKAEEVPEVHWRELELAEAERQRLVHVEARGADLSGVSVRVRGLVLTPMRLVIKAGTVFDPVGSSGVQSMVVLHQTELYVPGSTQYQEVATACINMRLKAPTMGNQLRLSTSQISSDLARLLAAPGFSQEPFSVQQYAIWTVTNDPARGEYPRISSESVGPLPGYALHGMGMEMRNRIAKCFSLAGIDFQRYKVFQERSPNSAAEGWEQLVVRLADENPTIRCHALSALLKLPPSDQTALLLAERLADRGEVPRDASLHYEFWRGRTSLLRIGHVAAEGLARWGYRKWLIQALTSQNAAIRAHAASGLADVHAASRLADASADCESALIALVGDSSPDVRAAVAWSLPPVIRRKPRERGARLDHRELAALTALLIDEDVEVRQTVLEKLMNIDFESVAGAQGLTVPVMAVLKHDQWPVAAHFLGQLKAKEAIALLASLAQGDKAQLRYAAIEALGRIGTPDAEIALRAIVDTPTDDLDRRSAQGRAEHWLEQIAKSRAKLKRGGA